MRKVGELADRLEDRWRATGYDNQAFPVLAAEALRESELPGTLDIWDELRKLGATRELTEQRDLGAAFSNLPITLTNRARFYVDLYLWLDGTTSIHQHSFSGAFQVVDGASLHSRYRFEERRRINEHFRLGATHLESVELLGPGDIREITSGSGFAHSLFHLARPSATITVRTNLDTTTLPQLDYLPPSVAINPFFTESLTTRKLQSAAFFLDAGREDADEFIASLLRDSDPQLAFKLLSELNQRARRTSLEQHFEPGASRSRFAGLLEVARERHGPVIDEMVPVFAQQNRTAEIIRRRGQVTRDDHRFFLALLLNLPDRARILELVAQRYPDTEAGEQVVEWVGELGRTRVWGSSEPNVLGLDDFDEQYLYLLELMLAGRSDEEIVDAVSTEYPGEQAAGLAPKIAERCGRLRELALLNNLLSR